jgi:hypothetical protein
LLKNINQDNTMTNFLEQAIFEHMGDNAGEDEAAATAKESASASTMLQLTGSP